MLTRKSFLIAAAVMDANWEHAKHIVPDSYSTERRNDCSDHKLFECKGHVSVVL